MHPLAERLLQGDIRALARACRLVDDAVGEYRALLKDLFPHTGGAWTIGVTGTPGAGKSTLCDQLIASFRGSGRRVGVVAIDPTSPFTGGAILGDRIRMQRHHDDTGVFIRSLATRGALGGLSRSAPDVIRVIDAWGPDVLLVETVGVGQDELEVTRTVDTTLVVSAPGMGDDVQAIKAGLLECADVFAVNKADRDGADATVRQLELMMALGQAVSSAWGPGAPTLLHASAPRVGHVGAGAPLVADRSDAAAWTAPVVKCVATKGQGVAELVVALEQHRAWLTGTEAGAARRLARLREAMTNQLRNALLEAALEGMGDAIDEVVQRVAKREIDPYTAADELVARFPGQRTQRA